MKSDFQLWNANSEEGSIHGCFQAQIKQLTSAIKYLKISDFRKETPPSKIVRDSLNTVFRTNGWDVSVLLSPRFPRDVPNQNVLLDACTDSSLGACRSRHLLGVEICFDNRQSIGTNLLKFEMSRREFQKSTGGDTLGLIVVCDKKTLRIGGWDSSVASSEEYELALSAAYRGLVKAPIGLLVLSFDK